MTSGTWGSRVLTSKKGKFFRDPSPAGSGFCVQVFGSRDEWDVGHGNWDMGLQGD
jgi:hypothetical protein